MKPWKQSLLNTTAYTIAFTAFSLFRKKQLDCVEILLLFAVCFAVNFLIFSAVHYANKH